MMHKHIIALLAASLPTQGAEITYSYRYENFIAPINRSNLAVEYKAAELIDQYDKHFRSGKDNCNAATNSDLRARFMAANMLAGYTMFSHFEKNDGYIKEMEKCLLRLTSSNIATDKDYNDLFGAYISARKFDSARSLAENHPDRDFPHVPRVYITSTFIENQRSVISLSHANDLVAASIPASPEISIIVVSGCHFALDALRSIESNEKIRTAFNKANALWLIPGDRTLDIAGLREIKSNFPSNRTYLVYKNSAWPEIDFSISPNFYFYKDGQLIRKIEGWSDHGTTKEMLSTLKEIGLLY